MTLLKKPANGIYDSVFSDLNTALDYLQDAKNKSNISSPSGFSQASYISGLDNKIDEYITICENIKSALIKGDNNLEEVFNEFSTLRNTFEPKIIKTKNEIIKNLI